MNWFTCLGRVTESESGGSAVNCALKWAGRWVYKAEDVEDDPNTSDSTAVSSDLFTVWFKEHGIGLVANSKEVRLLGGLPNNLAARSNCWRAFLALCGLFDDVSGLIRVETNQPLQCTQQNKALLTFWQNIKFNQIAMI